MITIDENWKATPEFVPIWNAIADLIIASNNYNPYKIDRLSKQYKNAVERIDRALIDIVKAVEKGDSLLPYDCE